MEKKLWNVSVMSCHHTYLNSCFTHLSSLLLSPGRELSQAEEEAKSRWPQAPPCRAPHLAYSLSLVNAAISKILRHPENARR